MDIQLLSFQDGLVVIHVELVVAENRINAVDSATIHNQFLVELGLPCCHDGAICLLLCFGREMKTIIMMKVP